MGMPARATRLMPVANYAVSRGLGGRLGWPGSMPEPRSLPGTRVSAGVIGAAIGSMLGAAMATGQALAQQGAFPPLPPVDPSEAASSAALPLA